MQLHESHVKSQPNRAVNQFGSNNVADPVCAWLMSSESGKWVSLTENKLKTDG